MSDDQPAVTETMTVLRREALLPNERNRGLGTVAVVCTMAGVASGLALATTLMAMQVADTMSTRPCTYRSVINVSPARTPDHGYLGVTYTYSNGSALVQRVLPGTPAAKVGLQRGDRVLSVDGDSVDSLDELQDLIARPGPGYKPTIAVKRGSTVKTVSPTLVSWPVSSY